MTPPITLTASDRFTTKASNPKRESHCTLVSVWPPLAFAGSAAFAFPPNSLLQFLELMRNVSHVTSRLIDFIVLVQSRFTIDSLGSMSSFM